jgi:hypothetical protein
MVETVTAVEATGLSGQGSRWASRMSGEAALSPAVLTFRPASETGAVPRRRSPMAPRAPAASMSRASGSMISPYVWALLRRAPESARRSNWSSRTRSSPRSDTEAASRARGAPSVAGDRLHFSNSESSVSDPRRRIGAAVLVRTSGFKTMGCWDGVQLLGPASRPAWTIPRTAPRKPATGNRRSPDSPRVTRSGRRSGRFCSTTSINVPSTDCTSRRLSPAPTSGLDFPGDHRCVDGTDYYARQYDLLDPSCSQRTGAHSR